MARANLKETVFHSKDEKPGGRRPSLAEDPMFQTWLMIVSLNYYFQVITIL